VDLEENCAKLELIRIDMPLCGAIHDAVWRQFEDYGGQAFWNRGGNQG